MKLNLRSLFAIALVLAVAVSLAWAAGDEDEEKGEEQQEEQQERVLKKRLAVVPTDVSIEQWSWGFGQQSLASGLTEMLTTELVKTGRYVVVEREAIDAALAEMELTDQGITTQQTGAKPGQAIGAEYLVKGTVTEFEHSQSGGGGGVSVAGFRIGGKAAKALIGLDIRIFNANTTEVLASEHVQGKAERKSGGFRLPIGSFDINAEGFDKTPLGEAMRNCVAKWVAYLDEELGDEPWEGAIVKADDPNSIYINAGTNLNIQVGDQFQVFHEGEKLIDPATGLELGAEREEAGVIEVTEVQEKYAIARAIEGETFERGDIIQEIRQ
jgi:curli biogenesis system outer membrane secretion channel CsgG